MLKSLLVPKKFMALSLLLILLSGLIKFEAALILKNLVLTVGTAFLTDLLLLKVRRINIFPTAALVSGLIIALLFSPDSPWYVLVTASFLAIVGKNLAHLFFSKHLLNPAAAGILVASLIFNQPVSWWGPSWGPLPYFLLIFLVSYLVLFRMRRWRIPLAFMITVAVSLVGFSKIYGITIENPLVSIPGFLSDPTGLFFALVMLPEPITSPGDHKKQIFYGIFVAITVFILPPILNSQLSIFNSLDPLITSLLLGNLVFKLI